jgi:branched-chain amino acid aminotransferase
VLWLDGVHQRYVEEVGSMNIFFIIGDEIITPALNGSILPGITRDSVIKLARSWGHKVTERRIGIDELVTAHEKGELKEVFGSGTAAVISPVGMMKYGDAVFTIGDGKAGPFSRKMFDALTDIQYGRATAAPEGWIVPVCD